MNIIFNQEKQDLLFENILITYKGDKIVWINNLWSELKKKYSLNTFWTLKLNHSVKTCGMCDYDTKTIYISKKYLLSDMVTLKQIINTLLHEIAHALVGPEHAHNQIWKSKALEIGCDGKIYNNLSHFISYKYKLVCEKGCFKQMRYKKSNISCKLCHYCKGKLSFILI